MARASMNPGDGSDALGRELDVTIRIGPDGRLYWNDLTIDLLPVARALCPGDPDLEARAAAARRMIEVQR